MLRAAHQPAQNPPVLVAWLGYGGLTPFVVTAVAAIAGGPHAAEADRAALAYGAVILSFVGALHWGFAMTLSGLDPGRRNAVFAWSVVPSLVAWAALLLPVSAAAVILVAGFLAHYAQDQRLARLAELPAWYLPLRLRLTGVACLCLVAVGASPLQ